MGCNKASRRPSPVIFGRRSQPTRRPPSSGTKEAETTNWLDALNKSGDLSALGHVRRTAATPHADPLPGRLTTRAFLQLRPILRPVKNPGDFNSLISDQINHDVRQGREHQFAPTRHAAACPTDAPKCLKPVAPLCKPFRRSVSLPPGYRWRCSRQFARSRRHLRATIGSSSGWLQKPLQPLANFFMARSGGTGISTV